MSTRIKEQDTGHMFLHSPGLPGVFRDVFVDFQLARAMGAQTYKGAEIGECLATAHRIADGDDDTYMKQWAATAERVLGVAEEALNRGHSVSARDALMRAMTYYRTAAFFLPPTAELVLDLWAKSRACFQRAIDLMDYPIEPVQIPYLDSMLPGYFMRPDDSSAPRKTVLIQGGADTTGEELYFFGGGAAAVERGYNALLFEGPGQKGAYFQDPQLVFRPDWEVPMKAVVDFALGRSEVDPERLGVIGYSMGGYFAPRAAAFEKRIKACVANSLFPNVQPALKGILGLMPSDDSSKAEEINFESNAAARLIRDDIAPRSGVDSVSALVDHWARYSLDGLEDQFDCHLLAISTEGEGGPMVRWARDYYERLNCPKTWHVFGMDEGAEAHCQVNNCALLHQVQFDWLDEVFD